jgi:hypothetical protein
MSAQKQGEDAETSEAPVPPLSSVELFREWVITAVAPPSLREEMLARIVLYGPDDLPEMIEVIDQAERLIRAENADFIRRATSGKRPRMTSRGREWMRAMVSNELVGRSHRRIEWLEKMRLYLEEEHEDYENEQRGCAILRVRDERSDSSQKSSVMEVPTRTSGVQESLNEEKDQGELISLASARRNPHDPLSQAIADAFARINARNPKKWVDVADRVGGLLLTIFLCTMAVVSVCGFALWWIEVLTSGGSWI